MKETHEAAVGGGDRNGDFELLKIQAKY